MHDTGGLTRWCLHYLSLCESRALQLRNRLLFSVLSTHHANRLNRRQQCFNRKTLQDENKPTCFAVSLPALEASSVGLSTLRGMLAPSLEAAPEAVGTSVDREVSPAREGGVRNEDTGNGAAGSCAVSAQRDRGRRRRDCEAPAVSVELLATTAAVVASRGFFVDFALPVAARAAAFGAPMGEARAPAALLSAPVVLAPGPAAAMALAVVPVSTSAG